MAAAVAARRPRRVRTATRLKVPDLEPTTTPLAHIGFEGARHQIPDRLPSARGERTVSMRVIDLNEDTLENIKQMGESLKRLDMSHVSLKALEEDFIKRLPQLERLDVSHNSLTEDGLPASLGQLNHLVELSIHNNHIGNVPKVIQKLKSLQRLKLGRNKITSIEGLEKLRKLTMLILDNNDIETFTKALYSSLRRLEYFHCSGNKIRDVPPEVRLWRHLKDLNLSHNELTYLPPEVFLLPRVDVLNASSNKISRLPSLTVKGKVKRMLALVDLSDNLIVKFPDYLLMMTQKLDLSRNRIRTIPGAIIKKLDYATKQVLCMDENPLSNPPRDICECGIRSIIQYFQEVRAEMKVYQGLKVLVLGETKAGKTSLIQTMVDGQSRLTDKEERTVLIDLYEAEYDLDNEGPMGRKLQLALWDFSGNPAYLYPAGMFLHQPSLAMVVFNMATYKAEHFHSTIGQWIDWIIVRKNKMVMLLVGTHADKVRRPRLQAVCAEISKAVEAYIKRYLAVIQREIQKIESLPNISPALSEQLKVYINLLKVQTTVHPQVVPVSSASMLGMGDLQTALVQMASDQQTFPHVLRTIPSLWVEVENHIDDKAWTLQVPLVRWADYVEDVVSKLGLRHLMEQITAYLHETGRVLWFAEHPQLRDYIVLRPNWFADLLKAIFRHDMATLDFGQDETLKLHGFNQVRLDKARTDLIEEGVLDKELLRFLWASLIPPDNAKVLHEVAHLFVEFFEIGYAVDKTDPSGRVSALSAGSERSGVVVTPQPQPASSLPSPTPRPLKSERRTKSRESVATTSDQRPASSQQQQQQNPQDVPLYQFSRILIPWLRGVSQPPGFRQEYENYVNNVALVANFRFPHHIPAGFFETLTVRVQKEALCMTTLYHWRGGMYAHSQEHPARFYLLRIDHEADSSTCVRMEMRQELASREDSDVETLWAVLLPILRETDNLISKFKGIRVERHMECPKCHALTFLGEWQTPKELQGLTSRSCETCKADVPAVYLIQPKEKKRVEEFLRKRIMEQQQERRLVEMSQNEAAIGGIDVSKKLEEIKEDKGAEAEEENKETKKETKKETVEVKGQNAGQEKASKRSQNGKFPHRAQGENVTNVSDRKRTETSSLKENSVTFSGSTSSEQERDGVQKRGVAVVK